MQDLRMTDGYDDELVVFLIGMTVNRPWRPDAWGPVFAAMPKMLAELHRNKERAERGEVPWWGFMGHQLAMGRGPLVVQYWRSSEDLIAWARSDEGAHRPAWKEFNLRVRRSPGVVGIWHETYVVPRGGHETLYSAADGIGLAAAAGAVPLASRGITARERLARSV